MQFCVNRPFLRWKFFQKRMARVAVDEIARRIVPTVSRQTSVAYDDWSRRKGIKGHAPSPVKGVARGVAEARYSGLHGRVQDEQALLAVPPIAFGSSLLREWSSRIKNVTRYFAVITRTSRLDTGIDM
ncbi:hypothetical protein PC128_g10718 [Phytophthora cactorum]|nr:hypothetical protein PC128_g10718 [Phytophthora cactorum]KAG4040823.1 hypothetical protein PC123_g23642 [Phytophthora cactorum]